MRILLTGRTGQVGNALLSTLQHLHQTEIIAPQRTQMDLNNPDQIRQLVRDIKPDLIINPAAYTAVDKAETEADLAQTVNGEIPGLMAEEVKKIGGALIHYSTDYVFDGSKRAKDNSLIAYIEEDQTAPVNVYGATKLAGEQAIIANNCNHLILRTSWVYSTFGKNFLLTMLRLANEREELKIVNDQWGAPTWAGWIAQATTDIVSQWQLAGMSQDWWEEQGGTYNFTSGGATNWCGFAQEIMAQADAKGLLKKNAPVVLGIPSADYPTPAKRPVNSILSSGKLRDKFGIQPPTWQDALAACLVSANN